ncbi:MAG: prolipoprotein diacylglyceryl transferase family protein, partial [Acidimicrobiales bacterium]
ADHLGATTTSPLGFRCPEIVDVGRTVGSRCPPGQLVHLTAAYDLLAALAICGALLFFQRRPRRHGQATFLLGLLYGLGRLGLDFLRQDIRRFGLTGSQWTALGLVAITLALLTRHRRQTDDPGDRAEGAPLTPSTSTVDEGDR